MRGLVGAEEGDFRRMHAEAENHLDITSFPRSWEEGLALGKFQALRAGQEFLDALPSEAA